MQTIITYETLYEILQKEKERKELQKLPESFMEQLIKYIEEKKLILESQRSKDTPFQSEVEKTEKQVNNIRRLVTELYERRERKIVETALLLSRSNKQNTKILSSMLPQEIEIYENTLNLLNSKRETILSSILTGNKPKIEKTKPLKTENTKTKLVRFLHPIPKFIGINKEVHGPFEKEDIASLDNNIAKILIEKQRAQEINYENT